MPGILNSNTKKTPEPAICSIFNSCFQIWICVYVILQYVIMELKLPFDQELKIQKMAVSGGFFCILIKN